MGTRLVPLSCADSGGPKADATFVPFLGQISEDALSHGVIFHTLPGKQNATFCSAKPSKKTTPGLLLLGFDAASLKTLEQTSWRAELCPPVPPGLLLYCRSSPSSIPGFSLHPGWGRASSVDPICRKPAAWIIISPPNQRDEAGTISSCSQFVPRQHRALG